MLRKGVGVAVRKPYRTRGARWLVDGCPICKGKWRNKCGKPENLRIWWDLFFVDGIRIEGEVVLGEFQGGGCAGGDLPVEA